MHHCRYYAHRMIIGSVSKSEYALFLAEHHLWGKTGAKFAYGLFATNGEAERGGLVAAVSFWWGGSPLLIV